MNETNGRLKPLKFALNLKTVLWGGEKIAAFKGLALPAGRTIGESWEVSGLTGHESVVTCGDDAGLTLRQLITRHRGRLVGNHIYRRYGNEFPLLVKFIDARDRLSVQVHPGDELAMERHGCSGKDEMWYIIEADPHATLVAGSNTPLSREQLLATLDGKRLESVLKRYPTAAGDCFYLPAGTLHSIGAGNLLLEIQQASDITYRVWDYDRRDGNGQPRQLHTRLALDAIDYNRLDADCRRYYERSADVATLCDGDYFTARRLMLDGSRAIDISMPADSFLIIINIGGNATINADSTQTTLAQGETLLVPAEASHLTAIGTATLITAHC
ncbi:MAG: class I mannose-6-phosphate isomerase [Muribaculaceae bacterium]|nr:class I mannose-6-phosphate isomerase [Muribaculaceae bacterium]